MPIKNNTTKISYISEASIVSSIGDHAGNFEATGLFPVVLPTEEIGIRVYRDVEQSLVNFKTFDFDYINKVNPLLEKELFGQLEKVLKKHGMTRDKNNPQIVISMDFYIGKREQYTPPTTVTSTKLMYNWNFGAFGGSYGGFSSTVPITSSQVIPGYTTTTFYSNIRLNFLDNSKLVKDVKTEIPPLIWIGEAESEGLESDIRGIAPDMFGELIGEFPNQSTKIPKRYVCRCRYGGLGLGFDTTDWRVVRYVEPFSVAAEHGIKPGDVIVKVNGNQAVINWGRGTQYLKNSRAYRSKDPYFQHVLSNRGESDVELAIKSAETKKIVKLNMRPRIESNYLYVNAHPLYKATGANPIGILFVIIVSVIVFYYMFFK